MEAYYFRFGASRGSAVYVTDPSAGPLPPVTLTEQGREEIRQVRKTEIGFAVSHRPVRPLPETDPCFENVWRDFRKRRSGNDCE